MIQLPELITEDQEAFTEGFKILTQIGKERIRRAGEKIVMETGCRDLDTGFKVFTLDSSNIKTWDPDSENLAWNIFDLQDNIKEGRSSDDLLFEILLKIGIPLTAPIDEVTFNGKSIYNVGKGSVLFCLENEIDLEIVKEMIKLKSEDRDPKIIFKETGFLNDSIKTNTLQTLKKSGIIDVKCI